MQYSITHRTGAMQQLIDDLGPSPIVKVFSGAAPANCGTADAGTLGVSFQGGGVAVPLTTNALTAANSNVLNFAATTGVANGQQISGTGIVAGSTVLAFTGTTVTMSKASTAGVANTTAIVFGAAFGTASGGVLTASAIANAAAVATITAGYYRAYPNTPTTTNAVIQGTVYQTTALVTNALTAANSNVLNFAATTGVVVGMTATGTGYPTGATVISTTGTTVTLSAVSTAGVANATTITFGGDMNLVNTSIAILQVCTVNSLTNTAFGA